VNRRDMAGVVEKLAQCYPPCTVNPTVTPSTTLPCPICYYSTTLSISLVLPIFTASETRAGGVTVSSSSRVSASAMLT